MAEQLWRRCPKAREIDDYREGYRIADWWCVCHGYGGDTLVPVPSSVLVIEDGFDAAVERMWWRRVEGHEDMPQGWKDAVRIDCEADLRAAVGEQEG